jgi:hypothetical protein
MSQYAYYPRFNREVAMKMLSLTAIYLAVATLVACSQDMTGAAKSPDNRAGTAATQSHAEPEAGRGNSGGGGGY